MKYFLYKHSLFNYILILLFFYLFENNDYSCPNQIIEKFYIIETLPYNLSFRFSDCFICTSYRKNNISTSTRNTNFKQYIKSHICLFTQQIYEFDNITNCKNRKDLNSYLNGSYYNLLINYDDFKLNYFIYFMGINNSINFIYSSFNISSSNFDLIQSQIIDVKVEDPKDISCQIDKNEDKFVCFYFFDLGVNVKKFSYESFKIFPNVFSYNYINCSEWANNWNNKEITIKTSISQDREKILVVFKKNKKYCLLFFLY